jgi:hypothetical protein
MCNDHTFIILPQINTDYPYSILGAINRAIIEILTLGVSRHVRELSTTAPEMLDAVMGVIVDLHDTGFWKTETWKDYAAPIVRRSASGQREGGWPATGSCRASVSSPACGRLTR